MTINCSPFILSGTYLVTSCTFWFANAFFLLLDITGTPQCLKKYKVQEEVKVGNSWKKCILNSRVSSLCINSHESYNVFFYFQTMFTFLEVRYLFKIHVLVFYVNWSGGSGINFLLWYNNQVLYFQPEMPKLWKAVKLVLFNQTVVGIPFCMVMSYIYEWRGCSVGGELPTFPWVMFEILVFSFVEEFFFYYSHRYGQPN